MALAVEANTREKAARSFSTVLKLMKEYPEYVFLQTQPQIYQYIKEDYPELYVQIKQRIAEGRWEVDGAMWVEADCNLPSGESLYSPDSLRKKFIREEFRARKHLSLAAGCFGIHGRCRRFWKKWNQYLYDDENKLESIQSHAKRHLSMEGDRWL